MDDELWFMYHTFESKANLCENWKKLSITDLANKYCDADEGKNEDDKEIYLSALMCRYWYMTTYLYNKSRTTNLQKSDFVFWVYDGLMLGFKYRRWRDPEYKVYHEENGAKKVFDRCFDTIRVRYYVSINRHSERANYGGNISFESTLDKYGDVVQSWYNNKASSNKTYQRSASEDVASYYIENKRILSALIVDSVCCQDVTIESKKKRNKTSSDYSYVSYVWNKCERVNNEKLCRFIKNADDSFFEYFKEKYGVDDALISKYSKYIRSLSIRSLRAKIEDAIDEMRNNKEVKNILCC